VQVSSLQNTSKTEDRPNCRSFQQQRADWTARPTGENDRTSAPASTTNWLNANYQDLSEVPPPSETFIRADDLLDTSTFRAAYDREGIIIRAGYTEHNGNEVMQFRITTYAYEYIQDLLEDDCTHQYFKNLGDNRYRCHQCDRELSRDELEASHGRDDE